MPIPPSPTAHDSLNTAFSSEGLRQAVRHGSRRTLVAQFLSHIVSLVVLATLYHLIAPAEFGLVGMALPVIMFLRIFTSLGMNIATVQSRELTPAVVSTLFWLHLLLGLAMTAVTVAIAPAVAWFYDEPVAAWVTAGLAGTAIISAAGLQHIALLERNLRLGSAAACRLVGQFVGGVLAIVMAVLGYGVWALVAQQYVELAALGLMAWYLEPWRPARPRAGGPVREALRLGGYFTATQIVLSLLSNIDKILVGFLLGARALGFYSQAATVMMKPVVVLTTPLQSVILPALSRSAHDREQYAQIVLAFQRLLAVASFPAAVGLMLVARDTMLVLGGPAWDEAGRLLSVLAATVLVAAFINMAGSIFVSSGQWRTMFVASLVMLATLAAGLAVGYVAGQRGDDPALGIAWGYSATMCLAIFWPYMALCLRSAGVSLSAWARQLVRPAAAALGMGLVVYAVKLGLEHVPSLPPLAALAVQISVGVIAYVALAGSEIRWCLDRLRRFET